MRAAPGAFLKTCDRGEATWDASCALAWEAESSGPVQAWPPTCRAAWGSNLLLSGPVCPHRQKERIEY